MRTRASAVVIGGGVGGCSVAYWLTKLGWEDVVLCERADLTSGSTFHSAGLVGQLRGSLRLTKMVMNSVEPFGGAAGAPPPGGGEAGAPPPGRRGEGVGAAARARLRRACAGPLPADVHGRR